MTDRLILTVAATQGPEGAACLAWQLSRGGVRAMGLAHTLPQVLQDVAAAVERDDAAAAHQFTSLSKPNYTMNPTDTEIEKLFRQWWAESFPNNPPGTHALRTHLGWARHLLNELNKPSN
jgi:hypothetical protein